MPPSVFISYSHRDAQWLERLKVHLKPLVRNSRLEAWADTALAPGDRWFDEIRQAIDRAAIAVLIISADFMASDFVASEELPRILLQAQTRGLRIIQIISGVSSWDRSELARFQTVNNPAEPLDAMTRHRQESTFAQAAAAVESLISVRQASEDVAAVRNELNELTEKVARLFLLTMSGPMFENLSKLAAGTFTHFRKDAGLDRELRHLRDIGYIRIKGGQGIGGIPHEGPNLGDYAEVTEAGHEFVRLRTELTR